MPKYSNTGQLSYNASSPDELAFTNAARFFGLEFSERDANNTIVLKNKLDGSSSHFLLLNVIEFTSARKRMTVIVKVQSNNTILCMTKGADSIILPRLRSGQ